MHCFFCKKEVSITDRVGRAETCPHCSSDLHVCRNCAHYDPKAYNECREPQTERVLEKDRSNFCDYFFPASERGRQATIDPAAEAKGKLKELFKR